MGIKAEEEAKFDMLTNKYSKFLIYHFNDLFDKLSLRTQHVRDREAVWDESSLIKLQHLNWTYLIEKFIAAGENITGIDFNETENEVLKDLVENYKIWRHFHKALCNSVADNF